MRLIDADTLKTDLTHFYDNEVTAKRLIDEQPTIDAIPVDWMVQRMNETSSGSGINVELNNALFTVGVEWEKWKKEHRIAHIDKEYGKWISVKDRLPDTYKAVITYDKRSGVKANWLLKTTPYVSWSQGYHVTHWMPIPEPPKEV